MEDIQRAQCGHGPDNRLQEAVHSMVQSWRVMLPSTTRAVLRREGDGPGLA